MAEGIRRQTFEWRQARVAALIMAGVLLLVYGVIRVGAIFDVFAKRYELLTLVPSALGLREGAPVTLAGQRIGQVSEIKFIPVRAKRDHNNLVVRIAISEKVRDQVRTDSRAFLRTEGLLGDKFVDIEPGSARARVLRAGDTLVTGPSVDMDQVIAQAAAALDQAGSIVTDLRTITAGVARGQGTIGKFLADDQLYNRMVGASAQLEGTLAQINRADGTFGRLIRDPALYGRIQGMVGRVDSIGGLILAGNGSLGRLLRDDQLFRSLAGTTARADSAVGGLAAMLERFRTGQGSLQKLMTDPELYDQFLKAVVDLQTLLNDVRREPGRYKPNINVKVF